MARSTPTVHDTTLLFYAEGQAISIVVGSAQWFEWLRRETTTIFSFHTHNASYTARKERAGNRRGEWYWKAYRTYQGKLYRVYMGKSEDLTLTRLHEIMQTLSSRIHEQAKQTPRMKDHLSVPANQQAYDDTVAMNQYPPRTEAVGPLLETRFHPPRLPPLLVERSRLLTLLDDGQQQKLTLVHAPAGFGKTTLITQWIAYRKHLADASQHAPAPVAWISLDSGDNDPIRFWSTVITACQAFHTSSGQTALTHLSQTSRSPFSSAPLETALAYLLNDLEHSASSGVLILEDYHLIEHKRIHETMAFFIEHVPPSLHIVILTRSEPPMPLVRWRARGNLLEISSNHLRFSIEDTASFLQQALPQAFSQAAVHPLHTHLEGWPAGLRLLLLSLQGHQTPQALEDALSELTTAVEAHQMHRSIQEFFLEEIFNAQPEALRVFLLQTSVLSRLTGSLCDAVTGTQDGAEWLNMIERSGFFLEALDSTGQWYRYHALWAATLRAEAARHLGPEVLRDLQLAASHWYAEHAMPVEAIEAALAALEFERAAHLIMQLNARSYFSEYHTMQRWIEQLPVPLLRAQPTLCFLLAQARLFSEENTGPQWRIETVADVLQMAEEGWRQQDDLFQLGILSAFRATFTLVHGHIARGAAYARQALQLLPPPETERPYDKLPAEWIEWHCGCLMALGMEASQAGAFTRAYPFLLEAFTLSLHKEDRVFTRIMGWLLGDVCSEMGKLHQAASFYRQALTEPPAQDPKGESILRANALAGLIRIAYEWNELEKAEQMIHEASLYEYRDDFSYGEASVRTKIELFRIILLSTRGERAAVHAALSALIVRLQANPHSLQLTFDVLLYQARLQIRDADLEGAESTLRMLDTGTQDLLPLQQEARQLLQARLHLAHNEANKAQPLLTHLLIEAQARQHLVRELEIRLLIALAHFACKQRPEAHQHLSHVLAQARNEGFVRMFLDEGEPLAALLRSLLPKLTENSQRTYVQTILQTCTNPEPKSKPGQPLLEPLSTQEQRVLALLVAGRSNPEIAETLIISVNTVKGHVKNLYRKLDVTNRMEASEVARRLKLI